MNTNRCMDNFYCQPIIVLVRFRFPVIVMRRVRSSVPADSLDIPRRASDNISEKCVMATNNTLSLSSRFCIGDGDSEISNEEMSFPSFARHSGFLSFLGCRFSETRSKSNRRGAKSWRKARRRRWHDELTTEQCLACRHINWNLACIATH